MRSSPWAWVLRNRFGTDREVWYVICWYCKLRHGAAVTQTQLSGKLTCRKEPYLCPLMTLCHFSGGFYPKWSGLILPCWEKWQNPNPKRYDYEKKQLHGFYDRPLQGLGIPFPQPQNLKHQKWMANLDVSVLVVTTDLLRCPQDIGMEVCTRHTGGRCD